ncbi:ATP-dependent helicase HrpB [Congregibacter litoralis KT71]|uniref:ATP-dependent helicase HrpB n=2 Tax=Congregibacter TaxID=393661 RepID=A4A9V3_9GAMM|nr:ATP-dependent helicase HrpB [Congregibacter litoralis KT71]
MPIGRKPINRDFIMPLNTAALGLPICNLLEEIRARLQEERNLVLEAPTGAGKTTVVPLALLDETWLTNRKIIMLQPRRLAAKNAALRMATLLGESPGQTVGYRMRLDSKTSSATRIEVVTEGILLRMLQDDPSLSDVGLIIFDEFHERSLDGDLGLSLALNARDTFSRSPTLRIMLMSATLGTAALEAFLECKAVKSEGRLFPVEERYGQNSKPRERIVDRVTRSINKALAGHPDSSLLVFLPGQGEIRRTMEQLDPPPGVELRPLYGDLSLGEQQAAIAPCREGRRKVVLATNIAETSLTIDGVDVVIDSGLERKPRFDPQTAMSRLTTVKISQASSVQRKGRAGRLRPGTCYRLWSEAQQEQLAAQDEPEIQSADLSSLALQLFAFGVYDPGELAWLTAPPAGAYQQAIDLLLGLAALEKTDAGLRLTPHGNAMAEISAHPRLAHMLLLGDAVGARETAAHLAAVLSDRDPLSRDSADMRTRLEYLSGEVACPGALRAWEKRTLQLARQLSQQLPKATRPNAGKPSYEQLPGLLLASAYPDRIARQRHSGGYQLANGRSCRFASPNALDKSKWLAVAEVGGVAGRTGDVIRSAAPLDPALFDTLLKPQLSEATIVDWDNKSGRFLAERRTSVGALSLRKVQLDSVSDEARTQRLIELTREANMANLSWSAPCEELRNKVRLMARLESDWPSLESEDLVPTLEDWLAPYLLAVKKLSDLKKLDLYTALESLLSWEQQRRLRAELPERFEVPSGSKVAIDYREDPPILPVKLQEMFGCRDTPSIAGGRIALVVHLLSPAGRPLQVTQDLPSFWNNSYDAVKKEMRGRYPKHPWPDDPLSATPTRFTKHRKQS